MPVHDGDDLDLIPENSVVNPERETGRGLRPNVAAHEPV